MDRSQWGSGVSPKSDPGAVQVIDFSKKLAK